MGPGPDFGHSWSANREEDQEEKEEEEKTVAVHQHEVTTGFLHVGFCDTDVAVRCLLTVGMDVSRLLDNL